MATAIETTSSQPATPKSTANLALTSLIGAIYVIAAVVVVFYALPNVWSQSVSPSLGSNGMLDLGLRIVVQAAAAVALVWFGRTLAGVNPPKGLRGGIFLMITVGVVIFFIARRVGLMTEDYGAGHIITGLITAFMTAMAFRFFRSASGERTMIKLEEQGWFSAHGYKKALGQKVRRLTILGFLLIGGSGVYTLYFHRLIPNNYVINMPFGWGSFTLIPEANFAVPLLLLLLTLWVAYRVVNMPMFAEFLIATEAEMNKVSWTSRQGLIRDTIVVLTTTVLLTMFLLFVDVFWGWLLSRETVGVLPSPSETKAKQDNNQPVEW